MPLQRLAIAIALGLLSTSAFADVKAVKGGSTSLAINNSGAIDLRSDTPIQYFNRTIAQGRSVVNVRPGQPLLCVDFAAAPTGNRVGLNLTDLNGEATGTLFGGISSFDFRTNGNLPSQFRVSSDGNLACCTMLPAINASCMQGSFGGLVLNNLFNNGFELNQLPPGTLATDLVVTGTVPTTINAGGTLAYSYTVSNAGGAANNVRVRDWYQKSAGFTTFLTDGTWTCTPTAGASCGVSGSQTGNIVLNNVTLDGGASITISVSRPVAAGAPNGSQMTVSLAAFSPPGETESSLQNNQAGTRITVGQFGYTATGSLSFTGTQGIPTATQNVVVTANAGNAGPLVISNCTFGGSHPSDFSLDLSPGFPRQVAVGGTLNLPVRFTGSALGARSSILNCITNATSPAQPSFQVSLSGTASAPNSAPTISDIGNQTGREDTPTSAIAFTANDSDDVLTPASFSCNDSALVAPAGCAFAGSEPNFTLTITPKSNANGSAQVQVTVTDGSSNSASDSFQLTLDAVNDAPDFQLANDVSYTISGSTSRTVSNFVQNRVPGGGPDELGQTTSVASTSVISGNAVLSSAPFYDPNFNTLSLGLTGTAGTAVIRVRVEDNGPNGGPNGDVNFRERDFTVTVNPPSRLDKARSK